jgi:hypothetical protein
MAETQRVSSPLLSDPSRLRTARRPRLPHPPPRYKASPLIPVDATESLGPRVQHEALLATSPREEAAQALPVEEPHVERDRRDTAPRFPPRTRAERILMVVLLLGLGLTAIVLATNPALTRSDFLLGGTVLIAGSALLGLMEICRRTCPPRR